MTDRGYFRPLFGLLRFKPVYNFGCRVRSGKVTATLVSLIYLMMMLKGKIDCVDKSSFPSGFLFFFGETGIADILLAEGLLFSLLF